MAYNYNRGRGQQRYQPYRQAPKKQNTLKKIGDYQFNNDVTDKKSFLGGGAFGKVYRGYHIKTQKEVAIKVIAMSSVDKKTIEYEIKVYK